MEDLKVLISKLAVQSSLLTLDILQELLIKIKKNYKLFNSDSGEVKEIQKKLLEALWTHLQTGLTELDDQLLCSTCFYCILSIGEVEDKFLKLILESISEELSNRRKGIDDQTKTRKTISIIYGIFQSNLLPLKNSQHVNILEDIMSYVMNLLIDMAYEYSYNTFIVFKILASTKKVLGTNLQNTVFTKDNQLRLLSMINHNWENPINGIRNLNRSILQNVICTMDSATFNEIIDEINNFYWNKAKYLLFTEFLEQYSGIFDTFLNKYNIVEGLMHSLYKPGLVSAGADLYFAVLKRIKSDEEWISIFLDKIVCILNSSNNKPIDNFNNYWCLTTLKKFPSLSTTILSVLHTHNVSEVNLYSKLCVTKQIHKLNIIVKYDSVKTCSKKLLQQGIEHSYPHVRMLSFDILCLFHNKSWPDKDRYELVLNYLSDNINSDFTVLRLSMLNSLSIFLSNLQMLHLNSKNVPYTDIDNLLHFCVQLQNLVTKSLTLNGNYQRKITTIKVFNVIWNSFCEIPKKKQKQTKQTDYTIIKFIIEKGQWMLFNENVVQKLIKTLSDPADDVRDSVSELLQSYYSSIINQPNIINQITSDAIANFSSKFFYEINCGKSMIQLIINILMKEGCLEGSKFRDVEEIFNYAYKELIIEHELKRDILESIESGKQLHSYMCILCTVFEAVLKGSYELKVSKDIIWSLLDILEDTSSQFMLEQGAGISSDFSKMNDMVLKIVENSGYENIEDSDQAKITGLQQIVLNCLWLNAKESCNLASLIIQYYNCHMDLDMCKKSLYVITKVLETSRHKGAIEAAGVSLGESIRKLTSVPKCKLSDLPLQFLKHKLREFISEASNMASITRRGAGLSIMVHRIVSNDMQKQKPLFHYFMRTLLDCCKKLDDAAYSNELLNQYNEKDLPKAIYIHFLTRIVTDSSLSTEVMYYSSKLVDLAFENLTSPHWQIRNAALQLYGAFVPKLMGQKKASGDEDEVTATVACDEFRFHFPHLWSFILKELKQNSENENKLLSHSNLLPILNILGNMAKRYNFSYDLKPISDADDDLLNHLIHLLGSPLLTVRRLTAKCIFNMYTFNSIFDILFYIEKPCENFLHGCLLLLINCNNYYKDAIYNNKLCILKDKFNRQMQGYHSYLCMELIQSISNDKDYQFSEMQSILIQLKGGYGPGKFQWAFTYIKNFLLTCPWSMVSQSVRLILENSEHERYCKVLYIRIDSSDKVDYNALVEITKILLSFLQNNNNCVIWKLLYKISLLISFDQHIDVRNITDHVTYDISYKTRYMIPLIARVATNSDILLNICKHIQKLCDPEVSDVDMRTIAVIANNELAKKMSVLPDEVKVISLINAVVLLQDEEEDVRNLSVFFYKYATQKVSTVHSYICLTRILDAQFLRSILCDFKLGVDLICNGLLNYFMTVGCNDSDEFNPFTNKSKKIYQELDIVRELIFNLRNISISLQ